MRRSIPDGVRISSRLMPALTPTLLAGRRAAFHGPPESGLDPLRAALAADPGQPRVRWLLGVCLGALGRYGEAAEVLAPTLDTDPLAASTRASHLRQLERHGEAEELDQAALRLAARELAAGDRDARGAARAPDLAAEPGAARGLPARQPGAAGESDARGPDAPRWDARLEAYPDALVGLVADAVGRYDAAAARDRLAAATRYVAALADPMPPAGVAAPGWRARIRLAWVGAEVALLCGRPADAAEQAADAVRRATAAGAPRHLAKSLLFRGVAEQVLGDPAAAATLDRAARAAAELGLLPLVWPARLVRARILTTSDPEAAHSDLAAARTAMRGIAVRLPAGLSLPFSPERVEASPTSRT